MKNSLYIIISMFLTFMLVKNALADERSDSTLNVDRLGAQTETIDRDAYAKIYYVSVHYGNDKGDGSQQAPWQTIINALEQIKNTSAKEKYAILASEGIYNHATINMKNFVDIYGGFNSKDWKRDIYKYTTILDGDGIRRVVVGSNNARLDGFTIQNGLSRSHGAGILCQDTSPQISNNFIVNNLVLEPADFDPSHIHQQGNNGGGIACLYNAVPVIRNNIFYRNRTSVGTGAAISFYGWVRHKGGPQMVIKENRLSGGLKPRVENNVIVNNTSGINDIYRTRSSSGGGISCAYEGRPIIQNNLVAINQAKGNSDAGGIYCEYFSDPWINGNWILGNIADDDGGGFYTMKLGQPLLTNNFFAGNYTTGGGVGGIRISKEGRARIASNIIVYNPGGGVMCVDSYMELEDNIIMHNPKGSGVRYVMNYSYFLPALIRNNVVHHNEDGEITIVKNEGENLLIENNAKEAELLFVSDKDTIQGKIVSVTFDPLYYTSNLITDKNIANIGDLAGRTIKVGTQWSVIKKIEGTNITIWGELSNKPNENFAIISQFMER